MPLLQDEYQLIDRFIPGFREQLELNGYHALEQELGLGFSLFKKFSAQSILLPKRYGGMGANAVDAVSFQLALASLAPSLAIGTTMHQYKVVTLAEMNEGGSLTQVLIDVVNNRWLVASGGSEGIPGQSLFNPQMSARDTDSGIVVTGTKKPCSMTWSMDILSVMIKSDDQSRYRGELLNVLIDPNHPSVTRQRFFENSVLQATESDLISLNETPVPEHLIFPLGSLGSVKPFANVAFLWFELLAASSYLGMAGRLLQQTIGIRENAVVQLAEMIVSFDTHKFALQQMAFQLDQGDRSDALLAKVLNVRYSTQAAIASITSGCFELLGGLAFSQSTEGHSLMSCARALCFHPPGKHAMSQNIVQQKLGKAFQLS